MKKFTVSLLVVDIVQTGFLPVVHVTLSGASPRKDSSTVLYAPTFATPLFL